MDLRDRGIIRIGHRLFDGKCAKYQGSLDKSRANFEIGVVGVNLFLLKNHLGP